jgi:hypothetical protein
MPFLATISLFSLLNVGEGRAVEDKVAYHVIRGRRPGKTAYGVAAYINFAVLKKKGKTPRFHLSQARKTIVGEIAHLSSSKDRSSLQRLT